MILAQALAVAADGGVEVGPGGLREAVGKRAWSGVLLGLGAGSLAMFVSRYCKVNMTCVELDPMVVTIAKKHFGLEEEEGCLTVVQGDGIEYVTSLAESSGGQLGNGVANGGGAAPPDRQVDFIWVDISSGDAAKPMTCPSEQFVAPHVLDTYYKCLTPDGAVIFNVVCRSKRKLEQVMSGIRQVFPWSVMLQVEDSVNMVVVASKVRFEAEGEGIPEALKGVFSEYLAQVW